MSDKDTELALIQKDLKAVKTLFGRVEKGMENLADLSTTVAVLTEQVKNATERMDEMDERQQSHIERDEQRAHDINERLEEYRKSSREDHQILADSSRQDRILRNQEIMSELSKMNGQLDSRIGKIESRVSELENWKWWIMGIGLGVVWLVTHSMEIFK